MNSNRASAGEYNFFFYDNGEKKKKEEERQPSQETESLKTSETESSHEKEVKTKTAVVVTPPPVRPSRRFLTSLFTLSFFPDDWYVALGFEHNYYTDRNHGKSFKDEAPAFMIRTKIARFLVLDGSIPLDFFHAGLRIIRGGILTEYELPKIKRTFSPTLYFSTGLLYNNRWKYKDHLIRYGSNYTYNYTYEEAELPSMKRLSWYTGGGIRFRFFNAVDLTTSLNLLPMRKASYLLLTGASIVF